MNRTKGNVTAMTLDKRDKRKKAHGSGKPENLLDNLKKTFDNSYDVVIFGHSHSSFCEKIGKTLYFNPGSPTDKIFATHNSYGVIEINETIDAKIIRIN